MIFINFDTPVATQKNPSKFSDLFVSKQKINNCLKYKAVKNSCSFSGHPWPLLGKISELLKADLASSGIESLASACSYPPPPQSASERSETACMGFLRIQILMACERYDECSTVISKKGLTICSPLQIDWVFLYCRVYVQYFVWRMLHDIDHKISPQSCTGFLHRTQLLHPCSDHTK